MISQDVTSFLQQIIDVDHHVSRGFICHVMRGCSRASRTCVPTRVETALKFFSCVRQPQCCDCCPMLQGMGSEFGSTAGCSWSSLSEKKTKMVALKQNRPGLRALQAEVQLQMSWARPKQHRSFPNIRPKCGLAPEALRNSRPWQWKAFKGFVRIISHQT